MHDDDRAAARAQFLQQGDDGALGDGVNGREGFIHEVEARVLHQRAGEECALLLAATELADLARRQLRDADLLQRLLRALPLLRSGSPQPAEAAVEPHHDHVLHRGREVPVDAAALRHVAREAAGMGNGLTEDMHRAGGARDEVKRGANERGLARAVGPDDGHQHALGHLQVDVP